MSLTLLDNSYYFPDPNMALTNPNGLLAIGGDLSYGRIIKAYQMGIFPWYSSNEPILWWSPDPRAVLWPNDLHISRSMNKFIRKTDYLITLNYDFHAVITGCASSRNTDQTWITDEIQMAYLKLHQLGFAHSVEVWQNGDLIGGLYGIAQGQLFCGESMFSKKTNASKLALIAFCRYFVAQGGQLIDCQVLNPHTESLGAIEITRHRYLTLLTQLQPSSLSYDCWQKKTLDI